MTQVDYALLQHRYGGKYVARRDGEVIASAETYDNLIDQLEKPETDWADLVIEYIEPANIVCVY